ncbi:hypothetical protein HDU79_009322 [Rhizoclosmatium sp. JEL0117]|nr:hypothetical protein HDU79_009322 [Rhizoclosmatium sp. JEL0117]
MGTSEAPPPPPPIPETKEFHKVEHILDSRKSSDGRSTEYLVKWENNSDQMTWVAAADIFNCAELVKAFEQRSKTSAKHDAQAEPVNDADDEEVDEIQINLSEKDDEDFVMDEQEDDEEEDALSDDFDELDLEKAQRRKPKKILGKHLEKSGRVVYNVLWNDGSQAKIPLAEINKDSRLIKLVEDYNNDPDQESPASKSTRSTRRRQSKMDDEDEDDDDEDEDEEMVTTRTSSRRRGKEAQVSRRVENKKRSTRSGTKSSKPASSGGAAKRANLIEDSDEEDEDDEVDYDKKDGKSKRRRNGEDDDDDEDEDEEESGDEMQIDLRGDDEEGSDNEDDDEEEEADRRNSRPVGLNTHHAECHRCGEGPDENNRKKKDRDIMGASGPLLPCSTCASQCHENCYSKPSKKDKEKHIHNAQQIGFEVKDFQCSDCYALNLPLCELCEKPPLFEAPDTDNPSPVPNDSEDEPKPIKSLHADEVTPLFRCQRCKVITHLSCLVKKYPAKSFQDLADPPTSRKPLGSPGFYTHHWTCFECCKWDTDVETILTLRDVVIDNGDDSDMVVDGVPQASAKKTRREYYIKFAGLSHRWNEWVPARWVEGQKTCQAKLGVFLRDKLEDWQQLNHGVVKQPVTGVKAKEIKDVVLEAWLRADKILDIKMNGKEGIKSGTDIRKLELEDVDAVYVKWDNLAYDCVTWEEVPDIFEEGRMDGIEEGSDEWFKKKVEDEMYPSLKAAFEGWKKRNIIGVYDKRKDRNSLKPKFVEFTEQPDFVKNGVLKDYQIDGLNWLMYKWTKNIPCILADEMGLGKTVQIVSFINALFTLHNQYPFMILAPSITIGHWQDEFAKWAPEIVAVHYTGTKTDRTMIRDYEINGPKGSSRFRFHVLLANYEMMMNESSLFRDIPFAALVCDEGHRLKNDESKTFRNLMNNIKVEHKVVLSGTPLQNNMRELFNLMNFLDSKKWEDPKDLASKFGIENIKDDDTIIPLIHDYLRPYFLRRTKKEVLTFLPPKAEIVVPISLSSVQKELYKAVLSKNFQLLRSIGVQEKGEKTAAPLKNILMELRKICNHPYLASTTNMEPPDATAADLHKLMVDACGKFALLQPMLRKLKDTGHRVLIFSQFKIALDIIEDFLEGEGYKYQRIDGDTPTSTRHSMITKFNEPGSEDFVFLLTTRTGGTGINLTSADTVIIYDSDWNPHQDIQAVARVHRIGQTKPVLIYKLCTRDSIEESVLERSTSKLVLDKIVVGAMKEEENINTKELSSILKYGAKKLFEEASEDKEESAATKYDEAAIDKLLDRDTIIATEAAKQAEAEKLATESNVDGAPKPGLNFAFAKIWTQDAAEETTNQSDVGTVETAEEGSSEQNDKDFWDKLLKDRIELARLNEENRTLGKRQRKSVNYSEKLKKAETKKELELDGIYEPDGDTEDDSASDFSDVEGVQAEIVYDPVSDEQWLPWIDGSHHVDPATGRQRTLDQSSDMLKCWLCLQPSCRFRTQCVKAKNTAFLQTLLVGLTNVLANKKTDANMSSIEFKIKIVQRLLSKATKNSADSIVPGDSSRSVSRLADTSSKKSKLDEVIAKASNAQLTSGIQPKLPTGLHLDDIVKFRQQLQSLKSMLGTQPSASPVVPAAVAPTPTANGNSSDPICWFCGGQGHSSEACHKVTFENIDNTVLDYLEAFYESKKLKADRYSVLKAFATAMLKQKHEASRRKAMDLALKM